MSNAENPFDPLGRNPYQSPGPAPVGQSDLGPPRQQSMMAIISLITGILSIVSNLVGCCCCFFISGGGGVLGLVAVVLGYMGMQECKEQGKSGKEMALAGLICGAVGIVLGILIVALSLLGVLAQAGAGAANQFNQPNFNP